MPARSTRRLARGLRELEEVDAVFGALAHASRRHILLVIEFRGGAMTAGEIAERFSCSWPTTTRHLKVLVSAGLLECEKRGRERLYTIDRNRLRTTVSGWLKWFEQEPRTNP